MTAPANFCAPLTAEGFAEATAGRERPVCDKSEGGECHMAAEDGAGVATGEV